LGSFLFVLIFFLGTTGLVKHIITLVNKVQELCLMHKKSPFIALLVLCLLLISMSTTFAASWKYILTSNISEHYFDTQTARYIIIGDETYIEAWRLGVYKNVQPDGAKTYRDKWLLKLDRKSFVIREHYVYDTIKGYVEKNN